MGTALDDDEAARWSAWKRASDTVWAAVVADIAAATGLSGPDFSVLTRVLEEGDGRLRQQRLADLLGWERSRLSRHLDRMERRGLVRRAGDTTERLVESTPEGASVAARARTAHADAVRTHLLGRLPPDSSAAFWAAVDALGAR